MAGTLRMHQQPDKSEAACLTCSQSSVLKALGGQVSCHSHLLRRLRRTRAQTAHRQLAVVPWRKEYREGHRTAQDATIVFVSSIPASKGLRREAVDPFSRTYDKNLAISADHTNSNRDGRTWSLQRAQSSKLVH